MSGDFVIDPAGRVDPPEFLSWMPSRLLLSHILNFLAEETEDPELQASLVEFIEKGYSYIALGMFSEKQSDEIMRIIRTSLLPAVAEWFPGNKDTYEFATEFVDMIKQAETLERVDQEKM